MPSEYTGPSSNKPRSGVWVWNIGGRNLPSITEPQPTVRNPNRYWIQDEGRNWHEVDPEDYGGEGDPLRLSDLNPPPRGRDEMAPGEHMSEDELARIKDTMRQQMNLSDLFSRRVAEPPQ